MTWQEDACYENFWVYGTQSFIYIAAENKHEDCWRLLKFARSCESELSVSEDVTKYSYAELRNSLDQLNLGNAHSGGLRTIAGPLAALIGCFRFTACFYLLFASRIRSQGKLCGSDIWSIEDTLLINLAPSSTPSLAPVPSTDVRWLRLFSLITLSKDFFGSYSFPIWATVQQNIFSSPQLQDPFSSDRVWNAHITAPLRRALTNPDQKWTVPLIHGSFYQRKLSLLDRPLTLTLIGRRSRNFAGTRYLKRGINSEGSVANDVEIEQILEVGGLVPNMLSIASMTQVRGSVPLLWSQMRDPGDNTQYLRPSLRMLHFLDPGYTSTQKHIENLRHRFGNPIVCLDLLRQSDHRRQESILSAEYAKAVRVLNARLTNEEDRIRYVAFDLRRHTKSASRSSSSSLLHELQNVQQPLMESTGFFAAHVGKGVLRLQHGVVRTNCMDCLDRTNVAQFSFGHLAIGAQLFELGISPHVRLEPSSSLAAELMNAYEHMGNSLALQYGGSEAHTGVFQKWRGGGDWQATQHSRDFLTSMRRLYSNVVTDEDKQEAMNLFLGTMWAAGGIHSTGSNTGTRNAVTTSYYDSHRKKIQGLEEDVFAPHTAQDEKRAQTSPININSIEKREEQDIADMLETSSELNTIHRLPSSLSMSSLASSTDEASGMPTLLEVMSSAATTSLMEKTPPDSLCVAKESSLDVDGLDTCIDGKKKGVEVVTMMHQRDVECQKGGEAEAALKHWQRQWKSSQYHHQCSSMAGFHSPPHGPSCSTNGTTNNNNNNNSRSSSRSMNIESFQDILLNKPKEVRLSSLPHLSSSSHQHPHQHASPSSPPWMLLGKESSISSPEPIDMQMSMSTLPPSSLSSPFPGSMHISSPISSPMTPPTKNIRQLEEEIEQKQLECFHSPVLTPRVGGIHDLESLNLEGASSLSREREARRQRQGGDIHTAAVGNITITAPPPSSSSSFSHIDRPQPILLRRDGVKQEEGMISKLGSKKVSFANLAALTSYVYRYGSTNETTATHSTTVSTTVSTSKAGDLAGHGDMSTGHKKHERVVLRYQNKECGDDGTKSTTFKAFQAHPIDIAAVLRQQRAVVHGLDTLGLDEVVQSLWYKSTKDVGEMLDKHKRKYEEETDGLLRQVQPLMPHEFASCALIFAS